LAAVTNYNKLIKSLRIKRPRVDLSTSGQVSVFMPFFFLDIQSRSLSIKYVVKHLDAKYIKMHKRENSNFEVLFYKYYVTLKFKYLNHCPKLDETNTQNMYLISFNYM
jgi:hypothetical protein